jgi:hypothetical protein
MKKEISRKDRTAFQFGEVFNFDVMTYHITGSVYPVKRKIVLEKDFYPAIREAAYKCGWLYHRIETVDQRGQPDILVTNGSEYWFIEVKVLHKSKLVDLQEDLKWQFGQLGFMARCFQNRTHYILAVIADRSNKGASVLFLMQDEVFQRFGEPSFIKAL